VTTSLATGGFAAISVFPLLAPWVWVLLLGIGLGGLFALSLTLPADNAPDADEAGRLAATTFRIGYILSSLGPFAVGALRQVTESCAASFVVLAVLSFVLLPASTGLRPLACS
jgi:CP family cyanate transporter-like MFS transporter